MEEVAEGGGHRFLLQKREVVAYVTCCFAQLLVVKKVQRLRQARAASNGAASNGLKSSKLA